MYVRTLGSTTIPFVILAGLNVAIVIIVWRQVRETHQQERFIVSKVVVNFSYVSILFQLTPDQSETANSKLLVQNGTSGEHQSVSRVPSRRQYKVK